MSSSDGKKTVLITGATGTTGKAAVRESLALGLKVRAMVHGIDERSQALAGMGAEVVIGDLLEINTIRAALAGIDAAYFVYPIRPGLIQATVNFAQAVRETGGNVVLNLSQRSAHREATSNSSRDTYICEQVFNWSGVDVIHLRPTMFQEWLTYPWMRPYIQHGALRMSAGQGTSSPVAGADQGRAIAALLLHPEKHIGTTIPLSGPAEMNQEQMAAELSEALGRKIVYQNPPVDEFAASLAQFGVPPYGVQHVRGTMIDYQIGRLSGADDNIEKLTGKRPMTVGEFARAHAGLLTGVTG
jgi:NAD(P)H dehydrogenase (quinone)